MQQQQQQQQNEIGKNGDLSPLGTDFEMCLTRLLTSLSLSKQQTGIQKLKNLLDNPSSKNNENNGENNGNVAEEINAQEFMIHYTTCYDMCTQKPPHDYSEALYKKYKEVFEEYIDSVCIPALKSRSGEFLLRELDLRWKNHDIMVRWMSRFFNYLDRYYIARHSYASLKDVGMTCFRDRVYKTLAGAMKDATLTLIDKEREGEQIDRALVKSIVSIFVQMGSDPNSEPLQAYELDFETPMLNVTAAHYKRQAAVWIEEESCPNYLVLAEGCLDMEKDRVQHYLHPSTEPKLMSKIEHEILAEHETKLLEKEGSGVSWLLNNDRKEDLARLFRLFTRIPNGVDPIAKAFKDHVTERGLELVEMATQSINEEGTVSGKQQALPSTVEQSFVQDIIKCHDKYIAFVSECFNDDVVFQRAFKDAFERFCNKSIGEVTIAELLANFCHSVLKKGGKEKLTDEVIEDHLEKIVKLLAYISDKDLFAEIAKQKLATRLLQDQSASEDLERSLLSKLKQCNGAQFTMKMESMVSDIQMAKENNPKYVEWLKEKSAKNNEPMPKTDMNVTILADGSWPTYTVMAMTLPEELTECVKKYEEFYENTYASRKLTWIFGAGSGVTLNIKFAQKPIEISCSTLQASILLLFREFDSLKVEEICEKMGVGIDDLREELPAIMFSKFKLLKHQPANPDEKKRTINALDVITFNDDFTDKARKIKIPKMSKVDRKKVNEIVDQDRDQTILAAVVRVMKSRKTMKHGDIQLEVVNSLKKLFLPEVKKVKKMIEKAIDQEYIERDPDDKMKFRYLA
jgi:cullin 1